VLEPALVPRRIRCQLLEGDVVCGVFLIDVYNRKIITWRAVMNAEISSADIRDLLFEAIERRFSALRASDHRGSHRYITRDTQIFDRQLFLKPCCAPVGSPQSSSMPEDFVKTLKPDYFQVTPLTDAPTVLGSIGTCAADYNDNDPHSGLKVRSPREFIAA